VCGTCSEELSLRAPQLCAPVCCAKGSKPSQRTSLSLRLCQYLPADVREMLFQVFSALDRAQRKLGFNHADLGMR